MVLAAAALISCADKQAPPAATAATKPAAAASASAAPIARAGHIPRAALDAVLQQGAFWVLEQVPIEQVMDKGKFVGWRVLELPRQWASAELQPGDVVTKINTMSLERPEDFFAAWSTLSVASELKVAYLRDGEAKEMSMPIDGSPDPALSQRFQQHAKGPSTSKDLPPPPAQYQPPRVKKTIVIKGEDRPLSDTRVD